MASVIEASQIASDLQLIGTHDGTFHADELLAIAMLRALPQFAGATIVRTRDQATLASCTVVVDVGGVYDVDRNRFDHHQRDFSCTMHELGATTKLSSAGLVYRSYGAACIESIVGTTVDLTAAAHAELFKRIYKTFIEAIDANDNGIECGEQLITVLTDLPSRVQHANPGWNQPRTPAAANVAFADTLRWLQAEFETFVLRTATRWWPARDVLLEAVNARFRYHLSGQIIVLAPYVPYEDHLYEIEQEQELQPVLFVLYETTDESPVWRIKTVAEKMGSFTPRRQLPEAWAGLKGDELDAATGLQGGVFVHAGRFIGAASTKAAALAMARAAL